MLDSLQYIRYTNFEVVCVNGPSTDGTDDLLEAWRGKIKIARCLKANLSQSRNIGIREAAGEIVCFIDDDAVPEPGWLSAIVTAYDDPNVGAVGGYIRDHTGVAYQAKHLLCDRFADSFAYSAEKCAACPDMFYTALTGTNCSFRRSALVQLGGFDEAYAYFLDETDVLIRLHAAGYVIACIEQAEIHHKYAPSNMRNEEKIAKTLYYPIRSKTYYAYRHALPTHGLEQVLSRLDGYCSQVASSQEWLYKRKRVSKEHYESLLGDIHKGRKDGLALAFHAGAPFVKQASYFADPPTFLPLQPEKSVRDRLKITFISQDYLPKPNGGIGVWVGTLAKRLAARGNEITVITRTENEPSIDFENNVWVHRIKQRHMPDRPYTAPKDLPQITYDWSATAYEELLQVAVMRGVDIVSAPIWDVEGIVTHCSGTIPIALSLHTSYGLALPSKPQWRENSEYMAGHVQPVINAEKLLFDKAPLVFANSRAIVRDLEKCYASSLDASRIALIPHGLQDECSGECYVPQDTKKELVVLFVGRFEERKGINLLLAAIPAILRHYATVRFVLAGEHGISSFWKKFTQRHKDEPWFSRVQAPGFVSREQLAILYGDCAIFVAPSLYESFGLIYLEAMMRGKPCIGTNAGGIPEVVRDNVTGIIVDSSDEKALQEALSTLLEQEDLRESMGKKAREVFLTEYTDSRMAEEFEFSVKEFLQSHN